MKVLVTGGAGYIGSHACVELLEAGYEVVIADNLSNSKEVVIDRIKTITGKSVKFYKLDITNREELDNMFKKENPEAVMHFAGLKAVGESVAIPLRYFYNNITGTLILLEIMNRYNTKKLVFSSSATVYGNPAKVPITEDFPLSATNPYGRTKLMIEDILRDYHISDSSMNIAILRYFNPIGAHRSGLIGEDPSGIPNNLMPYISKVAVGKLERLSIYGNDYPTRDGTGIRDYIHVTDLVEGHLKAMQKLMEKPGIVTYNLGTGRGYSVLEVVNAFERTNGVKIPYLIAGRRPGDIAECYADPSKAEKELGWKAEKNMDEMCRDTWRWQSANPEGYQNG